MRWEDERYVRMYTRDTVSWIKLPWNARTLMWALLRAVDRAGILDMKDGSASDTEALAALLRCPVEVVAEGLPRLVESGSVSLAGTRLVLPNFIEAQEAPQSDAARKKTSRERARDMARLEGSTGAHVTNRGKASQIVTTSEHAPKTESVQNVRQETPSKGQSRSQNEANGHVLARASEGTARHGTEGSVGSGSDAREATPSPRSEIDALANPDAVRALVALQAHPALRTIATPRVAEHAVAGLLGGNTTIADVLSGIRDLGMKAGGAEAAAHAWTTAQLAESLGAFIDRARANRESGTRNGSSNGRAKPLPSAKQNVPDYLAQQAERERQEDEEEARLAAAGGKT